MCLMVSLETKQSREITRNKLKPHPPNIFSELPELSKSPPVLSAQIKINCLSKFQPLISRPFSTSEIFQPGDHPIHPDRLRYRGCARISIPSHPYSPRIGRGSVSIQVNLDLLAIGDSKYSRGLQDSMF